MSKEPRVRLIKNGSVVGSVWEDDNGDLVLEEEESGEKMRVGSVGVAVDALNADSIDAGTADADLITHSTTIDKDYTIPDGKGTVISGPLEGTGSISGQGSVSVVGDRENFTSDVDGNGYDITNLGSLSTAEQITNYLDKVVGDPEISTPANFVADSNNVALSLQLWDDAAATGSSGYATILEFLAENGNRIGHWSADNDGDIALYTRDGPASDDTSGLTKALNVNRTGTTRKFRVINIDNVEFRGRMIHHLTENPLRTELGDENYVLDFPTSAKFNIRRGDDTQNAWMEIQASDGSTIWQFQADESQDDQLNVYDRTGAVAFAQRQSDDSGAPLFLHEQPVRFNGTFTDFSQNPVSNLREVSNAAPGDLANGEWAFDTNRGNSGTGAWLFKDASGTVHYWTPDGTL